MTMQGHSYLWGQPGLTVSLTHHVWAPTNMSRGLSWLRVTMEWQVLGYWVLWGQTAWIKSCFSWPLTLSQHQLLHL